MVKTADIIAEFEIPAGDYSERAEAVRREEYGERVENWCKANSHSADTLTREDVNELLVILPYLNGIDNELRIISLPSSPLPVIYSKIGKAKSLVELFSQSGEIVFSYAVQLRDDMDRIAGYVVRDKPPVRFHVECGWVKEGALMLGDHTSVHVTEVDSAEEVISFIENIYNAGPESYIDPEAKPE